MGCFPAKVQKDVDSNEKKIEELDHPQQAEMKKIMGEFVEAVPEGVEIEEGCVVLFDVEGYNIIASTKPECPWAGKEEWREQFSKFVGAANEFVATDSFNSFPVLGLLTGPSHHLLACYRLGNGGHMVFYACSKGGEKEEGDVDVDALNTVGYEFGGKLVKLLLEGEEEE